MEKNLNQFSLIKTKSPNENLFNRNDEEEEEDFFNEIEDLNQLESYK